VCCSPTVTSVQVLPVEEPVTRVGRKLCADPPPPVIPSPPAPLHQICPRMVSAQSWYQLVDTSAHWFPTAYLAWLGKVGERRLAGEVLSVKSLAGEGAWPWLPQQYMAWALSIAQLVERPTEILIHFAQGAVGLWVTKPEVPSPRLVPL
jgi:hypothetical protein